MNTPFTVAGVRGTEFYLGSRPTDASHGVRRHGARPEPAGSLSLDRRPVGGRRSGQGPGPAHRRAAARRRAVGALLPAGRLPPRRRVSRRVPAGRAWSGTPTEAYATGRSRARVAERRGRPGTTCATRAFFTYRAQLLLAVGRVDDGRADIGRALGSRRTTPTRCACRRSSPSRRTTRTGLEHRAEDRRREPDPRRRGSRCRTRSRRGSICRARGRA